MNIFLICFLFLVHLKVSSSIKPSDFCINTNSNCIKHIDSRNKHKTTCEMTKCDEKRAYDCKTGYCSVDRNSCSILVGISSSIKLIKDMKMFQNNIDNYEKFVKRVMSCSGENLVWKPSNYCSYNEYKSRHLNCKGDISFDCLNYLCSTTRKECDYIKYVYKHNKKLLNDIKMCNRSYLKVLIYKEKLF